jgi:hypothetical protein
MRGQRGSNCPKAVRASSCAGVTIEKPPLTSPGGGFVMIALRLR